MPFDPTTATAVGGTFDPSTARAFDPTTAAPVDQDGGGLFKHILDYFHGPSAMEQDASIRQKVSEMYTAKTGRQPMDDPVAFAGFSLTDPEARKLVSPVAQGFQPGEGLARGQMVMKGVPKPQPPVPAPVARARESGYVLPPSSTGGAGPLTKAGEALGGTIKTQEKASVKNQAVTNRMATKELGLPEGTVLTDQVFADVRKSAGEAYERVKTSIPAITADDTFLNSVIDLGGSRSAAAAEFKTLLKRPDIEALKDGLIENTQFSPEAAVELVKQLRADSRINLKNYSDPGKQALGYAQKDAANAMDELIERNLERAGLGDLVTEYRDARKLIAKAHDIEAATNTATGNVDAIAIGKLADKKRLSDGLAKIADTARSFPKAMRDPTKFGGDKPYSGYDALGFAFSGGLEMLGHPSVAISTAVPFLARPAARSAILSEPVQRALATRQAPPPRTSTALDALQAAPGTSP